MCEKIREDMTGEKLLWTKPLLGIHQLSASQSLELMQASYTPIQCVKICQKYCTQDRSLIPISKNSRLDKTDHAILRIWSCRFPRNKTRLQK